MAGTRTTDFSTADQLVALVEAQVAAGDLTRASGCRPCAPGRRGGRRPNTVAAAYRRLRERAWSPVGGDRAPSSPIARRRRRRQAPRCRRASSTR
ncbi:MAG: hypothetical protein R2705_09070 [Ilumatobacteraceae bacterium]